MSAVTAVPGAGVCESTTPTGPGDSAVSSWSSDTPAASSAVRAAASVRPSRFGTPARTTSATAVPRGTTDRAAGSWPSTIVGGPGSTVVEVLPTASPMPAITSVAASSA